jgi:hypothetical protein
MLIQVHYTDKRFDYVKDNMLHGLIESKSITGFRRSSGWVTVGVDPVRQFQRNFKPVSEDYPKSIVQVAYDEKHYDYVIEDTLNALIDTKKIVKFKRVTGWVTLGVDSLRKAKRDHTYKYPNELKKIK